MSAAVPNYEYDQTINQWAGTLAWDNDLLETAGKIGARAEVSMEVFSKIFPPLDMLKSYARISRAAAFVENLTTSTKSLSETYEVNVENGHFKRKPVALSVFNSFFSAVSVGWAIAAIALVANPVVLAGAYLSSAVSAMVEAYEAISKARHSKHKSDPVHLLEDRLKKYDRITQALDLIGTANDVARQHLLVEQKRIAFQAKALANHVESKCFVSLKMQQRFQSHPCYQQRGEPTPVQANIVRYLLNKQKRMVSIHAKEAVGKGITALGLLTLGMAAVATMAFPPLAAGMAIAGIATLAVGAAVSVFSSGPAQGFSLFGFKSGARKRFETVFNYMAITLTEDGKHPGVSETMASLKEAKVRLKAGDKAAVKEVAKLQSKLHQKVENVLVRRHLSLSPKDDIDEIISKNDRKRIVGLECKALIKPAKEFLSERDQAKHKAKVAKQIEQASVGERRGVENTDTLFSDSYLMSHIPDSPMPGIDGQQRGSSMDELDEGETEGL